MAISDSRRLSEDVLIATIYLVEQTLKARRLTAVSDRPEDLTAFTPDHFLLRQENASVLFMPFSERYNNLENLSKLLKHLSTWNIWTREYLAQVCQRSKWSKAIERKLNEE